VVEELSVMRAELRRSLRISDLQAANGVSPCQVAVLPAPGIGVAKTRRGEPVPGSEIRTAPPDSGEGNRGVLATGGRILIVHDDERECSALAAMLTDGDFDTRMAADGQEALERATIRGRRGFDPAERPSFSCVWCKARSVGSFITRP
jgi:hypothetical protein